MKFKLVEQILFESKADEQRLIQFAGEDLAKRFLALKQRFKSPENDLYYWIKNKSVEELENAVLELEQNKSKTQIKAQADEGAKLVGENDYWKVYHITTFEASQKYGKDTKWCITGIHNSGRIHWDQYTREGIEFYFYITKGEYDPRGRDSKFALAYSPKEPDTYEIYDQQDSKVGGIPNAPIISNLPDIDIATLDTYEYRGQDLPEKTFIRNLIIDGTLGIVKAAMFKGNTNIEKVIIRPGITEIEASAFHGCSSITSIELPDTLIQVGESAFASCRSLKEIKFPDSLIKIPDFVLIGAFELKKVSLGKYVTTIGAAAFGNCINLTNIILPDSIMEIKEEAFSVRTNYTKYFSITCSKGTYAEKYAKRHRIPVNYLKESYSLKFKLVESIDDRLIEEVLEEGTIRGETSLRECLCSLIEWKCGIKIDPKSVMLHHKDGNHEMI